MCGRPWMDRVRAMSPRTATPTKTSVPPTSQPASHSPSLVTRSLGFVFALVALASLPWLVFAGHPAATNEPLLWGLVATGLLVGGALTGRGLDRAPALTLPAILTGGNLAVSLAVYAAATVESGYPFFYLWATPVVFIFFSRAQAALQTAIALTGFTVALLAAPGSAGLAGSAGLITFAWASVATVAVVGLLARWLTHELRAGDARYQLGFQSSSMGVMMLSSDLRYVEVNDSLARMLGRTRAEMIGRSGLEFTHPDDRRASAAFAAQVQAGGRAATFEKRYLHADGAVIWARVHATAVPAASPGPAALFVVVEDIDERRRAELDMADLARDNELILRSAGEGIIRIDTRGLISFANPSAAELLGRGENELLGERAHDLFHHSRADGSPYPLHESPIHSAVGGGEVERRTDEVFWRADGTSFPVEYTSAPIRERGEVIGAVCVFSDIADDLRRESDLRKATEGRERITEAISHGELVAFSQPIVDARTGRPVAEELLVRMRDGAGGRVVLPADFLPQAEESHLMPLIDRQMVHHAMALARVGRNATVNVSAQSLDDPAILVDLEAGALADESMKRITIEITETSAVENMTVARMFCERVRALGCRIALDDFGTGFGAFEYLRTIEFDYLKIDTDFVRDIAASRSDERIVRTIVGIARDRGVRTIAEGVESEETRALLVELGVDLAQGFLFGRPALLEVSAPPAAGPIINEPAPASTGNGPNRHEIHLVSDVHSAALDDDREGTSAG